MTTISLSALVKAVLLPPNIFFISIMLGVLVSVRFVRFGRALVYAAVQK